MSSESFTKKRLAIDMNMTDNRLTRYLLTLEPELLAKFPNYNRNSQILTLLQYRFILEDYYGSDQERINRIIKREINGNFGVQ